MNPVCLSFCLSNRLYTVLGRNADKHDHNEWKSKTYKQRGLTNLQDDRFREHVNWCTSCTKIYVAATWTCNITFSSRREHVLTHHLLAYLNRYRRSIVEYVPQPKNAFSFIFVQHSFRTQIRNNSFQQNEDFFLYCRCFNVGRRGQRFQRRPSPIYLH